MPRQLFFSRRGAFTAFVLSGLVLLLLATGCSTAEMKGTPFYRGDYGERRGPAEQRVNAWPVVYYRNPALSVLWPVLEFTDDHTALRPLFSVYGLDCTNRIYNVLWPLAQLDRQTGDSYAFPFFWGEEHFVVFPVYWHFEHPWGAQGGTDSFFPLWVFHRERTNEFSLFTPWPLVRQWSEAEGHEKGSMVLPLYWHQHNDKGSLFVSPLWLQGREPGGANWQLLTPLYYHVWSTNSSAFATPFWAQGHSGGGDWRALIPLCYWQPGQHTMLSPFWAHWQGHGSDRYFAPWALSWMTVEATNHNLWIAAGLAHASWGPDPKPHYVLPVYYRDASRGMLLTPLLGWSHPEGFLYPATPLFGLRNGQVQGSWLFPLYSHSRDTKQQETTDRLLLVAGHSKSRGESATWCFPLFSYHNLGPVDSVPEPGHTFGEYGTRLWCLPFCWFRNQSTVRPAREPMAKETDAGEPTSGNARSYVSSSRVTSNTPPVRSYSFKHGVFPLWSYSNEFASPGKTQTVKGSILLVCDYQHEIRPPDSANAVTNDYTRTRVLWRLWHYEKLNGNVSVDVFPTITYDRKTDGFRKASFLWRFLRYERAANGSKNLDVLFVPLLRKRV